MNQAVSLMSPYSTDFYILCQNKAFRYKNHKLVAISLHVVIHNNNDFIKQAISLNSYDSILPTLPISTSNLEKKYSLCEALVTEDLLLRDRAHLASVEGLVISNTDRIPATAKFGSALGVCCT